MFEDGGVGEPLTGAPRREQRGQQIEQLRARMQRMEQGLRGRELATHPALAGAVQLHAGGVYATDGLAVAMALLAGPSAAGEWCAVVGEPEFGAEAAAELGINLDRTILVPEPRESWLEATAALVDVAGMVVVRPPERVRAAVAEKMAARLRTRGAALVAIGDWPRADLRLSAAEPRWSGVGRGEGHLRTRRMVLEVQRGSAPPRRHPVWFPAEGSPLARSAPASAPLAPVEAVAG